MKNKTVAGVLALVAGYLGIHRFYLGQTGLGFLYVAALMFTMLLGIDGVDVGFFSMGVVTLVGFIDALALFSMDQKKFDEKYNKGQRERWEAREERMERRRERSAGRTAKRKPSRRSKQKQKNDMYLNRGKAKFKDYDYEGAIVEFNKALKQDPRNIAAHFNLACAHSLMEHKDKAFYHLDRAVALGFDDTDVIKTRDHLAFLRIQPEFVRFEANGFRLAGQLESPKEDVFDQVAKASPTGAQADLLDQLQRLANLKEKGVLTEEEFRKQKEKLLG